MANPFPGVDPFIESQGYWPDFHARFLTYCCDVLSDGLPTNYEAVIDEQFRLYESDEEERFRAVEPDVAVVRSGSRTGERAAGVIEVAVLKPVTVPVALDDTESLRHTWIEIRRFPERSLVAVLELLSPTNKHGHGRRDYLGKREAYLHQPIHLIELDFLLTGPRLPMAGPLPPGDCYAFVARAGRRPNCDVYAWSIRRRLPRIPIPLRRPDPDLTLDLAAVYATAHERGRYARRLDYAKPLGLPLADADRGWVAECLQPARGEAPR